MTRVLVVGGSDAGVAAGLRAREVDPDAEVALVVADRYPNFSICGLPFWLSGETPEWQDLAHRTRDTLEDAGLELLLDTTAIAIDPVDHELRIRPTANDTAPSSVRGYDQLVVATGARPSKPPIEGLQLDRVHVLRSMEHAFALDEDLQGAGHAAVVGGGYIGVELADALSRRGLDVTLVEMAEHVLTTVDASLGALVADELGANGVDVRTGTSVRRIEQEPAGRLAVRGDGCDLTADVVVVAAGVEPRSALAADVGAATGASGAVAVDRHMRTDLPDVFAAGDCVTTHHRLHDAPTYLPLGTTAHKQGRVAGENAVGGATTFAGSLGTQVVKVFDLVVARTGLRHHEALDAGWEPVTHEVVVDDHKAYYPGAVDIHVRLTGDRRTGRLLGAQLVGGVGAQVAKRVDVIATALFHEMAVDDLNDLDLAYTPPLSAPWDPVQAAAQSWAAVGPVTHDGTAPRGRP